MLKEQIKKLDIANEDFIKFTESKNLLNIKYKNLKKDLTKLLHTEEIDQKEYDSNLNKLNAAYKKQLEELQLETSESATYLTNEYEKFTNLKASKDEKIQNEILAEKNKALAAVQTKIDSYHDDKKYKKEIKELKTKKKEIKTLYSKSISNKSYLIYGLAIVLTLMIGAFLLAFLYINPNTAPLDVASFEGAFALVVIIIGTLVTLAFLFYQIWVGRKKWVLDRDKDTKPVIPELTVIMAFDTLGLGCFATITSLFKKNGLFNDNRKIAGTLNAGTAVGTIAGVLLTTAIDVQIWTLIAFVGSALIGAGIGAYLVKVIKAKRLTLVMGVVLSIASVITMLGCKGIELLPIGTLNGLADSENWWKLIIGMVCFIGLGMLLSFGIGIYAPAMVIVPLLGMNWATTLPIMLLSAGFAGQVSAYSSVKNNLYLPKTSWAMTIGTMIGNFLVFAIVFAGIQVGAGVNIDIIGIVLKWVSVFIIGYSAFLLLRSYFKMKDNKEKTSEKHLTKNALAKINYSSWLINVPKANINYQLENKNLNYKQVKW